MTMRLLFLRFLIVLFNCLCADAQKRSTNPAAVVLLGPSGSGKSETGNTLLDGLYFAVSGGLESETLVPQAQTVDLNGQTWQIVDTPGYFDTSRTPEELAAALERFSGIVSNRIVTLAFVVPYGRFGDSHLRGWRLLRSAFGMSALKYTLLVFTSVGARTEEDVKQEMAKLCTKTPPPILCGVIEELGAAHSCDGLDRVVTFGTLEPERRRRDRLKFFDFSTAIERAAGGRAYDHQEFVRSQARRKSLVERIAAVTVEEDRQVLEMLLSNVEAGTSSDEVLVRRLEAVEGKSRRERMVLVDFEDRTLGPFKQIGSGWRQPMPMPYASMKGYDVVGESSGGKLFIHTGTDSGVRLRHGDQRTGELRTEAFFLGRGAITWHGTGAGGYLAVCREDAEGDDGCIVQRLKRASTQLEEHRIDEDELDHLVGSKIHLRLVDDWRKGWGFIALDNLEYPVQEEASETHASAPQQATPQQASPQHDTPQQATPQQATPQQTPPQQAVQQQAAPEQNQQQAAPSATASPEGSAAALATTPAAAAEAAATGGVAAGQGPPAA